MSKTISPDELSKHADESSAWVAVDGTVYDVTDFASEHPGGKKILIKACGKDSSESFWKFHSAKVLTKTAKPMSIGTLGTKAKL